jgi:hypothetical protein
VLLDFCKTSLKLQAFTLVITVNDVWPGMLGHFAS